MTHFTAKITLAALIASAPLAGAYAQSFTPRMSPEDYAYSHSLATTVDNFTTASIGHSAPAAADILRTSPADRAYDASVAAQQQAVDTSLAGRLEIQIRAAEANVNAARQRGYVDAGSVFRLSSQVDAVRQQAAGGVTQAQYNDLSAQLKAVNQGVYSAVITR